MLSWFIGQLAWLLFVCLIFIGGLAVFVFYLTRKSPGVAKILGTLLLRWWTGR